RNTFRPGAISRPSTTSRDDVVPNGARAGEVQLWRGDQRIARAPLGTTSSRLVVDGREMAPGLYVFRLESSPAAMRGAGGRGPLRVIGLLRSSVGPPGAPAVADN
ncbi:MAG: hypothetical protein ACKOTF_13405, partial [Opitutaceae bacterium]